MRRVTLCILIVLLAVIWSSFMDVSVGTGSIPGVWVRSLTGTQAGVYWMPRNAQIECCLWTKPQGYPLIAVAIGLRGPSLQCCPDGKRPRRIL